MLLTEREEMALKWSCPTCGAEIGEACRFRQGSVVQVVQQSPQSNGGTHMSRLNLTRNG